MKAKLNVGEVRKDFPILQSTIHGKPLVYLDNAATTQKPQVVIDKIVQYYTGMNSNIHRGVHHLSQIATDAYENTRIIVSKFINSNNEREIVYTRGATESINLVAISYARNFLKSGDEIIISTLEHHANIVPWQMLRDEMGIVLKIAPIDENGDIIIEQYKELFTKRTKFVSLVHVSNSLGVVNNVNLLTKIAKENNCVVLIDGSQSIQHLKVDVQEMGCDFFVFSGHKLYAPTGIGILWAKEELLNNMTPYQGGGDMILSVSFDKTTYNEVPFKFEAGTQNIEGAIGLGTAIEYLNKLDMQLIAEYENELYKYMREQLSNIPDIRLIGNTSNMTSAASFHFEHIHPHDMGTMLDMEGIAIRTGHHCTEPVMKLYGIPATSRASISFYNTTEEIDKLVLAVDKAQAMFR
jgi:cysteine desulfurase / selenocysteine lyase